MAVNVCIVGAGAAGLRCATVLLEHGINVTIYEARDRVGGRIAQSNLMGALEVDIGANWVHSKGNNPILALAKATGTEVHSWTPGTLIIDSKGNLISTERANKALATVWTILEEAVKYSTSKSAQIEVSASLYDFFNIKCQEALLRGEMNQEEIDTVLSMSEMWGAYVGAKVERQSLKYFFLEDCIESDDYFIPSNYKAIMSEVARVPLSEAQVYLSAEVTSIKSTRDSSGSISVQVETGAEEAKTFDAVVVTTPLGWLKRNMDVISPFDHSLAASVKAVSFGNLEKVLVEFPSPFWQNSGEEPPSFVHWLSPAYAAETNPSGWRLECVSFSVFPEPYRRNILLFYTYGECALHIISLVHGKEGDERHQLLQNFFEPYYSRLPNWKESTCKPLRFLATEWSKDKLAGFGSYCNFQIGADDLDKHVCAMRRGMPEHNIYFAGEHTAPFDGLGTVAGAYTSGERVAHQLVKKYSRSEP